MQVNVSGKSDWKVNSPEKREATGGRRRRQWYHKQNVGGAVGVIWVHGPPDVERGLVG